MATPLRDSLEAIAKLSPIVVALLLVGTVVYIQMQERRFEAERSDRDRKLALIMLRESIDQAREDRDLMHERGNRFVENQKTFIALQDRLVVSMELQGEILRAMKRDQAHGTAVMQESLRAETEVLIKAIKNIGKSKAE